MSSESFFSHYLEYIGETEAPMFYHRWSALSMVGAYLGRDFYFPFGHFNIYPNMYVMLIGEPGTRKSTAIKLAKKIVTAAGYSTISSDKTSKEKFILDLAEQLEPQTTDDILDQNLWGMDSTSGSYSQMYIACDEFNDFIGLGNLEFISLLGNLWDFSGVFEHRVKNSKSVKVPDPTLSILGGNTATSFANAFPAETLGQGFFSRLLLIHAEPTDKRITFPASPSKELVAHTVSELQRIKSTCVGEAVLTPAARYLLDYIYKNTKPLDDPRFVSYSNRRFTHLIKLCLLISALHYSKTIEFEHVVEANTILTHTENLMPKALGQFGKARNSDIAHKILKVLKENGMGMSLKDIWTQLSSDMNKLEELIEHMKNLLFADKVLHSGGKYIYKERRVIERTGEELNYNYLTQEERDISL